MSDEDKDEIYQDILYETLMKIGENVFIEMMKFFYKYQPSSKFGTVCIDIYL